MLIIPFLCFAKNNCVCLFCTHAIKIPYPAIDSLHAQHQKIKRAALYGSDFKAFVLIAAFPAVSQASQKRLGLIYKIMQTKK